MNIISNGLPYYLAALWYHQTKGGNWAVQAIGASHPDDKNPPKSSPKVYIKADKFPVGESEKATSLWIQHRLRYHTLKIEGWWDFNELVRMCRPFRDTYGEVLINLRKTWDSTYPNWRTDRLLVAKLKYAIRREIPEFPVI